MKNLMRTCSPALLAIALGVPAFAQDNAGIDLQFRARAGYGMGSKDNLTHRTIGMGLELGYATPFGRFAGEVGFQYKPGDQYTHNWSYAPKLDGIELLPNLSGDNRQTSLQGLTFRAAYEYDLSNSLMVRGGIQVGGAKFRQDVRANVAYRNPSVYGTDIITDAYAGNFTQSELAPSPFIGLGYRLGQNSAVEINVLCLSYKAIDYVHVAGTGTTANGGTNNPGYNNSKDRFEENSRMIPHVELAYVFRF
jgi:hypothetical protein